jgi:iron complex transport system permease protein
MNDSTISDSNRVVPALAAGAALLSIAIALRLVLGSVSIPFVSVLRALLGLEPESEPFVRIVLEFRLPRAVTAAAAGAALSVSGLLMQTLFRNPLAGPSVLGITSGASLGVALVVLAGSTAGAGIVGGSGLLSAVSRGGDSVIAVSAVLGAGTVMLVVLLASGRVDSVLTLLVLGVLFSYAVSAAVNILMHFSIPQEIQSYINWTFGSFAGVTREQLGFLLIPILLGLVTALLLVRPLDALLLGEHYARTMGVNVVAVRVVAIAATSVLAGTVTAFCGPIAFLGVAVPHLARGVVRSSDHRHLVPVVLLFGAIVAVLSDLVASLPGLQITLPLNAVTSLLGAPVVIAVVVRRGGVRSAFT